MNKATKNLIQKYNTPDSLLVISSYPEKGVRSSGKVCAVGWVARNTLDSLKKSNSTRKLVVLTLVTDKEDIYVEDEVLVIRCFERNQSGSYLSLVKNILRFNKIKNALVEFEFASYGDTKTTSLFPLVLGLLRILNKKITLVLHQVVTDMSCLAGHVGFSEAGLKVSLFNLFLKFFYFFLCLPCQSVVVLDETFKERLQSLVGMGEKIFAIPLGVDLSTVKIFTQDDAKRRLNIKKDEFVLLYFGYLTWYKGADFLVKTFAENRIKIGNRPVRLIMAGGESATQKAKAHYQKFVKSVYSWSEKSKNITITGFIPEEKIPLYFAAADLSILPYRTFMSSSGPLSLTFSYGKPFIVSSRLRSYFEASDFRSALEETGIRSRDLVFSLASKSLLEKIKKIADNRTLKKVAKLSAIMAQKRDFQVLATQYESVLKGTKEAEAYRPLPQFSSEPALR